jgi:hypothetical protein
VLVQYLVRDLQISFNFFMRECHFVQFLANNVVDNVAEQAGRFFASHEPVCANVTE